MQLTCELAMFLFILWVSSGVDKLVRQAGLVNVLRAIGYEVAPPYIRLIGVGELVLGVITLYRPQIGGGLSSVALLIYSIGAVVVLVKTKQQVLCGCGGILGNHPLSVFHIARNLVFASMGIALMLVSTPTITLTPQGALVSGLGGAVVLAATSYMAGEVYSAIRA